MLSGQVQHLSSSSATTLQRSKSLAAADREVQPSEFSALKEQLDHSEKKVQALIASNDDMRTELAKLNSTVQRLVKDNKELQRVSMSPVHSHDSPSHSSHQPVNLLRGGAEPGPGAYERTGSPGSAHLPGPRDQPQPPSHGSPLRSPQSPGSRSHSMYEYRDTRSSCHPGPSGSGGSGGSGPTSLPPNPNTNYSPRNYPGSSVRRDSFGTESGFPRYQSQGSYGDVAGSNSLPYTFQSGTYGDSTVYQEVLPSQEEVVRRTEAITRCIQELLISAKDEKFDSFIPCSERIVRAVTDMVLLFPEEPAHSAVSASLSSLTAAATHFETECRMLILRSQKEPLNQNFVTQQVIQCAFDIAKATKQLVALFQ